MRIKELFVLALAVLCLADSLWLTAHSNVTAGLLLMYLLTGALFCYYGFHRQIDAFCTAGIGRVLKYCFFAGAAFFVSLCLLMAFSARPTATYKERAVVVLGAGLKGERISATLMRRLDTALLYHKENPDALLLVSGGQGPQESRTEASAMAEYLIRNGVPAEKVILEDRSDSTETNFLYCAPLLEENGISLEDPVCFITNDFHCYRSAAYARRAGYRQVTCLSTSTPPTTLLSASMREALAICALWAKGAGLL